jgi:hypothetical protein
MSVAWQGNHNSNSLESIPETESHPKRMAFFIGVISRKGAKVRKERKDFFIASRNDATAQRCESAHSWSLRRCAVASLRETNLSSLSLVLISLFFKESIKYQSVFPIN